MVYGTFPSQNCKFFGRPLVEHQSRPRCLQRYSSLPEERELCGMASGPRADKILMLLQCHDKTSVETEWPRAAVLDESQTYC